MAKLAFSFDGMIVKEIKLASDRVTIGRHAKCDIAINDPAITGKHAEIIPDRDNYFIEDSASTNGTVVNGVLISRQRLKHADVITLGKYQIIYLEELEYPDCRQIRFGEFQTISQQFNLAVKTRNVMSVYDRNNSIRSSATLEKVPAIVSKLPCSEGAIDAWPAEATKPAPNIVRKIISALRRK
jgi:predicted component of type VI protein secretion system